MRAIKNSDSVFIDPSPMALSSFSEEQMENQRGGAVVAVIIIACGGRLGAATIIITGTAIVSIAD